MTRALLTAVGLGCAVIAIAAGRLGRRCEAWLAAHDPAEVEVKT